MKALVHNSWQSFETAAISFEMDGKVNQSVTAQNNDRNWQAWRESTGLDVTILQEYLPSPAFGLRSCWDRSSKPDLEQ